VSIESLANRRRVAPDLRESVFFALRQAGRGPPTSESESIRTFQYRELHRLCKLARIGGEAKLATYRGTNPLWAHTDLEISHV
jgi:hypothetical protein